MLPTVLWRIALVLGFPSGYTAEGFTGFGTPGAKAWMLFLSVACELVALLTVGLVRPWGEVLPRWIPRIGGRTVRPLTAVVPALLGSVVLTALWAPMPWWWMFPHEDMTHTGHVLVGILYQPLVLWWPLVAAVAVSYYRRRRHAATGAAPRAPYTACTAYTAYTAQALNRASSSQQATLRSGPNTSSRTPGCAPADTVPRCPHHTRTRSWAPGARTP